MVLFHPLLLPIPCRRRRFPFSGDVLGEISSYPSEVENMGKTWEDGRWTTTIDFSLLCLFGFLFPSSSAAVTDEPRVEESARIPLPRIDGKTYVRSCFQHRELSPHFDLSSVVTLTYILISCCIFFLRCTIFLGCAISGRTTAQPPFSLGSNRF